MIVWVIGSGWLLGRATAAANFEVIDSSGLLDPLPDWPCVCEVTDIGLDRPEQSSDFEVIGACIWASIIVGAGITGEALPAKNIIA